MSLVPSRRDRDIQPRDEAPERPSNVHPFRRSVGEQVTESERAHFTALLDELIDLKSRLHAARRGGASRAS